MLKAFSQSWDCNSLLLRLLMRMVGFVRFVMFGVRKPATDIACAIWWVFCKNDNWLEVLKQWRIKLRWVGKSLRITQWNEDEAIFLLFTWRRCEVRHARVHQKVAAIIAKRQLWSWFIFYEGYRQLAATERSKHKYVKCGRPNAGEMKIICLDMVKKPVSFKGSVWTYASDDICLLE